MMQKSKKEIFDILKNGTKVNALIYQGLYGEVVLEKHESQKQSFFINFYVFKNNKLNINQSVMLEVNQSDNTSVEEAFKKVMVHTEEWRDILIGVSSKSSLLRG